MSTKKLQILGNISATPDWNAAEGESGHVLNRTHWVEVVTLLEESEATVYTHAQLGQVWLVEEAPELKIGTTYRVVYNGSAYDCECKVAPAGFSDDPDAMAMGNFSVAGGEDTGEPFAMLISNLYNRVDITDMSGATSVKVEILGEVIHKLDGKFLPDGVPYVEHGGSESVEILPEMSIALDEDGMGVLPLGLIIESGKTYDIVYNGETYTCPTQEITEDGITIIGLGNVGLISGSGDTGEPFVIAYDPTAYADMNCSGMIVSTAGIASTTITLSISEVGTQIVHKLDGKLLPAGVPYIEDEGVRTTILEETSYTGLNADGKEVEYIPLQSNTDYIVVWNGTEYNCTSYRNDLLPSFVFIGDCGVYSYGSNNTEPFGIISGTVEGQSLSLIASNDGTTEATVSIIKGEQIHKIDLRFLPKEAITTYTLEKDGSTIKLIGSDGSETRIEDSDTKYGLNSFGITVTAPVINGIAKKPGKNVAGEKFTIDGVEVTASSFAEVFNNTASNKATGSNSHAEGNWTTATGSDSHAEGYYTTATGSNSHAEGYYTIASRDNSHVQGQYNIEDTDKKYLHIVGNGTAINIRSNAHTIDGDGNGWFKGTIKIGGTGQDDTSAKEIATVGHKHFISDIDGINETIPIENGGTGATTKEAALKNLGITATATELNYVDGVTSNIQDQLNKKPGRKVEYGESFTINDTTVIAKSGAEIFNNLSTNIATGNYSHAEGDRTTATGDYSHAEGYNTIASGYTSHAEGYNTTASGSDSHAEGHQTTASGFYSHAEGRSRNILPETITSESTDEEIIAAWKNSSFLLAKGPNSHAEGYDTLALGTQSHAEGGETIASSYYSHAEGHQTIASGVSSHAEGYHTTASRDYSHAEGVYNIEDTAKQYLHIVGNGTAINNHSNAHTLDFNGNAWFSGDVYVGSTSGTNKDEGSKKLIAAPTDATAGDLLMYDGTNWVKLSKADLIAEIIAALPSAEEASF